MTLVDIESWNPQLEQVLKYEMVINTANRQIPIYKLKRVALENHLYDELIRDVNIKDRIDPVVLSEVYRGLQNDDDMFIIRHDIKLSSESSLKYDEKFSSTVNSFMIDIKKKCTENLDSWEMCAYDFDGDPIIVKEHETIDSIPPSRLSKFRLSRIPYKALWDEFKKIGRQTLDYMEALVK